jgi:hypothetical protein
MKLSYKLSDFDNLLKNLEIFNNNSKTGENGDDRFITFEITDGQLDLNQAIYLYKFLDKKIWVSNGEFAIKSYDDYVSMVTRQNLIRSFYEMFNGRRMYVSFVAARLHF